MIKYMNTCNGNGKATAEGKCACNSDWYGADCSVQIDNFFAPESRTINKPDIKGSRWNYFAINNQYDSFELTITSPKVKADVYFRKGGELPDEANFDGVIL